MANTDDAFNREDQGSSMIGAAINLSKVILSLQFPSLSDQSLLSM